MSRLCFVQVAGLKLDHLSACNVFGPLQTNQQLLDLIKFNDVPRQAGNVVRQAIIWAGNQWGVGAPSWRKLLTSSPPAASALHPTTPESAFARRSHPW